VPQKFHGDDISLTYDETLHSLLIYILPHNGHAIFNGI
jgi:hypothetical protein